MIVTHAVLGRLFPGATSLAEAVKESNMGSMDGMVRSGATGLGDSVIFVPQPMDTRIPMMAMAFMG
jgi:hypothetical protein